MTHIAAKPTIYEGVRFRSRLEARWAVFFDALGVRWEYEPIVADAPAGYLPDFDIGTYFIEIKPGNWLPSQISGEGDRAWEPSHDKHFKRWGRFVSHTDPKPLVVCFGEPGIWENGKLVRFPLAFIFHPGRADPAKWSECGICGLIRVAPNDEPVCNCPQVYDQLRAAFHAVRDASYEDAS